MFEDDIKNRRDITQASIDESLLQRYEIRIKELERQLILLRTEKQMETIRANRAEELATVLQKTINEICVKNES